jgi:hypothetical protein
MPATPVAQSYKNLSDFFQITVLHIYKKNIFKLQLFFLFISQGKLCEQFQKNWPPFFLKKDAETKGYCTVQRFINLIRNCLVVLKNNDT